MFLWTNPTFKPPFLCREGNQPKLSAPRPYFDPNFRFQSPLPQLELFLRSRSFSGTLKISQITLKHNFQCSFLFFPFDGYLCLSLFLWIFLLHLLVHLAKSFRSPWDRLLNLKEQYLIHLHNLLRLVFCLFIHYQEHGICFFYRIEKPWSFELLFARLIFPHHVAFSDNIK